MTLLKAMQPAMSGRGSMGRLGSIKRGNSDGVTAAAALNANSSLTRSKSNAQQHYPDTAAAGAPSELHPSPSPPGGTSPRQTYRSHSGRGALADMIGHHEVLRRGSSRLSRTSQQDV